MILGVCMFAGIMTLSNWSHQIAAGSQRTLILRNKGNLLWKDELRLEKAIRG